MSSTAGSVLFVAGLILLMTGALWGGWLLRLTENGALLFVALLVAGAMVVVGGINADNDQEAACESRGGVLVKSVCLDRASVIEMPQ